MTDLTLLETDRLILSGWRPDQIGDLYRLHAVFGFGELITLKCGVFGDQLPDALLIVHDQQFFHARHLLCMHLMGTVYQSAARGSIPTRLAPA